MRRLGLAVPLALALGGCGLPDELLEQTLSVEGRVGRVAEEVEERSRSLAGFLAGSENAFLRPYAERERWTGSFEEARRELAHARDVLASEIGPLLERDDGDDADALRGQLARAREAVDLAARKAGEPARRAAFLRDARDRAPELVREGEGSLVRAREILAGLRAELSRAQGDYPEKRDDLAGRLAALARIERDASESQRVAAGEQAKGEGADWARLGDASAAVRASAADLAQRDAELRVKVAELYRSYAKTLIDMREASTVEIGRTSWNEHFDFPSETEVRFRSEVSPEDLATLAARGDAPIATLSSFFGRSNLHLAVDRGLWDSLRIDPSAQMPRGDDSAEFWVGDWETRYYHRYALVEGERSTQTDWVLVDEDLYEEHYEDLGMDVLSKPYGLYEEEALREAAPPGLAYVGNPKYGRWETDEQGRRHWSWAESFLFYYLVFGGPRHAYSYEDWDRWNRGYRGRAGWYGSEGDRPAYGTYGTRTRNSTRYASTGFGRGGGFRRADASVRGAGPRGRAGGPGGGGK